MFNKKSPTLPYKSWSPLVEHGVVTSVKSNNIGTIRSFANGDDVLFSTMGASRAVVENGKARFQSLGFGAHVPKVGLRVAFIAGYAKPGEKTAIAEVWSSLDSWNKARVEARVSTNKSSKQEKLEEELARELCLPKSPPKVPPLFPEHKQKTPRGKTGRALKRRSLPRTATVK